MTEIKTETPKFCRAPKCRSKLPTPVTNPRDAFCCKGCRERFYRLRCYVCEEKKTSPRRAFSLRLIEKAVVKKRGVCHRCACNRFAAADLKRVTSGGSSLGNAFPPTATASLI